MVVKIGAVTITSVACALILGILANLLVNIKKKGGESSDGEKTEAAPEQVKEEIPEQKSAEVAEDEGV